MHAGLPFREGPGQSGFFSTFQTQLGRSGYRRLGGRLTMSSRSFITVPHRSLRENGHLVATAEPGYLRSDMD